MEEPLIKDELLKSISEEKLETASGGLAYYTVCKYCGGTNILGGVYCPDCDQKL